MMKSILVQIADNTDKILKENESLIAKVREGDNDSFLLLVETVYNKGSRFHDNPQNRKRVEHYARELAKKLNLPIRENSSN